MDKVHIIELLHSIDAEDSDRLKTCRFELPLAQDVLLEKAAANLVVAYYISLGEDALRPGRATPLPSRSRRWSPTRAGRW